MTTRNVFRNWTLHCAVGELLGFGAVGLLAGGYMVLFGEPRTMPARLGFLALMLLAGSLEGGLLGYFQSRVLRRVFWRFSPQNWIGLTVVVAVAGWFLGMLPSTLIAEDATSAGPDFDVAPGLFLLFSGGAGLVAGALFGWVQWYELRRHTRRAGWWIVANALGWAVALSILYVAASWPNAQTPVWQTIAVSLAGGVGAGLSLGLSLGLITGLFLQALRPHHSLHTTGLHVGPTRSIAFRLRT